MQLLSLSPMMAALTAPSGAPQFPELLQHPELQQLQSFFLAQAAVAQVVTILAYWLASKAVAEEGKATFFTALKLWLSYLIFWFVSVFVIVILVLIVIAIAKGTHHLDPTLLTAGAVLTLFFFFLAALLIPMNVYSIGFLRALGFLILSALISCVGMIPVDMVLLKVTGRETSLSALQRAFVNSGGNANTFFQHLGARDTPDEIDRLLDEALSPKGPKPSLPEREAMVVTIQQKLSARKATLAPGDAAAHAAYQAQLNRYMQFRASVISEMNSHPRAAPLPR